MTANSAWQRFWYTEVATVRLAAFRTLIAITTLTRFGPRLLAQLDSLALDSFHYPWIAGLPVPSAPMIYGLKVLLLTAALGLLFGLATRACAWLIAGIGLWVFLLDFSFFHNSEWLHLLLLFLVGLASDRIRIWDLTGGDAQRQRTAGWVEQLIRVQLAIVFLYATIHKVLSPEWGFTGTKLLDLITHPSDLAALVWFDTGNDLLITTFPGLLSVIVIGLEAALTVLLLRPKPWGLAALAIVGFCFYIEIFLSPGEFSWDICAALLLVVPTGPTDVKNVAGSACRLAIEPDCPRCQRRRKSVTALDWLGRVAFEPAPARESGPCSGWRLRDHNQELTGLRAAVRLAFNAVTPVLLFVWLAGSFGLQWSTPHISSADLLFVGAVIALALGLLDAWGRQRRCAQRG